MNCCYAAEATPIVAFLCRSSWWSSFSGPSSFSSSSSLSVSHTLLTNKANVSNVMSCVKKTLMYKAWKMATGQPAKEDQLTKSDSQAARTFVFLTCSLLDLPPEVVVKCKHRMTRHDTSIIQIDFIHCPTNAIIPASCIRIIGSTHVFIPGHQHRVKHCLVFQTNLLNAEVFVLSFS